jgi:hypothetical protein
VPRKEGRKGDIPKIRGGSRVHLCNLGIYNVPHPLGFTHCKAQDNVITIAKTFEKIPQYMYNLEVPVSPQHIGSKFKSK